MKLLLVVHADWVCNQVESVLSFDEVNTDCEKVAKTATGLFARVARLLYNETSVKSLALVMGNRMSSEELAAVWEEFAVTSYPCSVLY